MNEKILTKFILAFLIDKPDYLQLSQHQQQLVFETSKQLWWQFIMRLNMTMFIQL